MTDRAAAERFRQQELAGPKVLPQLIGPASLVGVCLGMLAAGVGWQLDGPGNLLLGVPLIGAVLLPLPGHLRQLGTGLLASLAVWFVAPFAFVSMYITLDAAGLA